jgi:hypothetical protein
MKKPRMGKRSKRTYVREEIFAELMKSAQQALAYECGAREGYWVTEVPLFTSTQPISRGVITRVRKQLNTSKTD